MRVRLTTDRCGPACGCQYAGQEVELAEDEARALLAAGQAEEIAAPTENTSPKRKRGKP